MQTQQMLQLFWDIHQFAWPENLWCSAKF